MSIGGDASFKRIKVSNKGIFKRGLHLVPFRWFFARKMYEKEACISMCPSPN